jgi:signal transduction histidine kinase
VDLDAYLSQFGALFKSAWPGVNLTVDTRMGGASVALDKSMLRQVLLNLCNNAAAAIGIRPGTIVVKAEAGTEVGITVTDNGPGIPEDFRPRLFDTYATTRPTGEGHGLGLAISRKIMLEHGGDLELLTTSPAGTSFRLTLPLEPETGPVSASPIHPATEQGS